MESAGEKAEVPVQSTTAPVEAEKPAESKEPVPQAAEDPNAGIKVSRVYDKWEYIFKYVFPRNYVFYLKR